MKEQRKSLKQQWVEKNESYRSGMLNHPPYHPPFFTNKVVYLVNLEKLAVLKYKVGHPFVLEISDHRSYACWGIPEKIRTDTWIDLGEL